MAGESYTWIDSTNTSHALDGSTGVEVLAGPIGLYMPPIQQLDQRTPLQPGTSIKYTDLQAKPITLPLHLEASTESGLETLKNTLVDSWFAAPGTLRRTRPDGVTQRDLLCYYLAGLEMDESGTDHRGPGWIDVALQLLAAQPFWTDTSDTTAGPYSNTQMGAGVTIANGGLYQVYPTWVIHGPFVNLVITNAATGLKMDFTANGGITFTGSDTLTIDADAGSFLKQDGTNQVGFLTTDSVPFPLIPGNNAITFTYTGGVGGTTTTTVTFRQRYRSP